MEHGLPATIALPIQLRVLSQTPERIRVRLAEDCREPEVMEQIAQALQQFVTQIRRVKTNPQTGSLTLYLNPGDGSWNEMFGPLEEMGLIAIASDSSDLPSASQQLTGLMASWNQRVNQWTEGTADLRFLMPMALAILALRRFLVNGGGLKSAPWYILAWYAFDSFIKLNSPPAARSEAKSKLETEPMPETELILETKLISEPELSEETIQQTLPPDQSSEPTEPNHHQKPTKPRSKKSVRTK